jgi:WD40 repeat protein
MIRIWDAATYGERFSLAGHDDWVFSLAFSPDGRRLVSGAGDGTLRIWDLNSRQPSAHFLGQQNIAAIRFSPDGRTIASTAADGTIFLRDATDGALLNVLRTRFGDRGLVLRPTRSVAP